MNRAASIKGYLQAGTSICPFAKACPLELATVSARPRADRAGILRSAAAFGTARGNAIILVAKADKGFTATASWATEAFLELMICCAQISQPSVAIAEIERYVESTVRPTLSSDEIRPHLSLHGKALMTICMAPVYPAAHPRYAPHTILVVTWSADVDEALGAGGIPKIREAMAKAHGHVYDANELVLPRPTKRRPALDPTRKVSKGDPPEAKIFPQHRLALGIACPEPSCRAPKGEWCPMPGTTWNLCGKRINTARDYDERGNEVQR